MYVYARVLVGVSECVCMHACMRAFVCACMHGACSISSITHLSKVSLDRVVAFAKRLGVVALCSSLASCGAVLVLLRALIMVRCPLEFACNCAQL